MEYTRLKLKMAPKWISRDTPLLPILLPHLTGAELPVPRSTVTAPHKSGHLFIFGSGVGGELGLGPGIHERRKPGQLKSFAVPLDHTNQLYAAAKEIPEVVAIECGGQHSLALDSQGRVWSWGINDQGALGRHTVEEILSGSDSDSDCSDKGPLITGKDAWWPGIVDIRNEQNNPVKVVQVR